MCLLILKNKVIWEGKKPSLSIFFQIISHYFFNSLCGLHFLAWFFFISFLSFIFCFSPPFILFKSLLHCSFMQPDLSSKYSCLLKCLFCLQSSYSTPHHSWNKFSYSLLDDATTGPEREKVIYTIYAHHVRACIADIMSMRIHPSPRERGERDQERNFIFLTSNH